MKQFDGEAYKKLMDNTKYYPEGDMSSHTSIKKVIRYSFPSVFKNGKLRNLDGTKELTAPVYHIYANEHNMEGFSIEEIKYIHSSDALMKYYAIEKKEMDALKRQLEKMTTKYQACENILERLRKSVWAYIAFRFKL